MPGRWQFAAAVVGAILFATIFYFRTLSGWDVGSDLRMIYDRAGDALREGGQVYWRDPVWNNYYYAPPPTVIYQQAPTTYVVPAPVQREVVYPHGKYVLYGDGVTQAWQWVWVPNAPANPPPPPTR